MPHRELESELLHRASAGERAALAQLLLIHHDALLRHIVHQSAGQPLGVMLAEDILQQTFVRAAQHIQSFRNDDTGSFLSWLKTIATNQIKDASKRRRRERRATSPHASHSDGGSFLQAVERLSGDLTPPITRVQRSESVRRLRAALASLPSEQREIVERYYLHSQSWEQIAESTGRTISSIRGICYRARKNLRSLMGGSSLYFSN